MIELKLEERHMDPEKGGGCYVHVPGFKGQPSCHDEFPTQVLIYVEDDKLEIRVWDGSTEDSNHQITIDRVESEAARTGRQFLAQGEDAARMAPLLDKVSEGIQLNEADATKLLEGIQRDAPKYYRFTESTRVDYMHACADECNDAVDSFDDFENSIREVFSEKYASKEEAELAVALVIARWFDVLPDRVELEEGNYEEAYG